MNNKISEQILDKFTKKFNAAYNKLGNDKFKILKYSPILFKRWYYSALVNETTLTPSFIYNVGVGNSGIVCAPSIFVQMAEGQLKDFYIKDNKYSVSSHPVIKDLENLINFCTPDIEMNEDYLIPASVAEKITPFLSLGDPFYVDYLTLIAFGLRLIKKSAAIYSNKAAVSDNYMSFFKLRQEDALKKVVDETIKLSSKSITNSLPQNLPMVSEKGILSLIKKPVPIDEIFRKIFSSFGVNIEYIWNNFENIDAQMGEEENSILSSAFFFGIILDKWFITPFSDYLKIIEPIYCYCYNFEEETKYLYDAATNNGNVNTALFSPCAFYSFTPLGRILFSSGSNIGGEGGRPFNIPVAELVKLLNSDGAYNNNLEPKSAYRETKMVFSFKVVLSSDKRCWKEIDAADYNTLHELHMQIKGPDTNKFDYCFYTSETMTPFTKYVSPYSKSKFRNADNATIMELSLIKGSKMIYTVGGKEFEIELIKCLPVKKRELFPKTVKQSKLEL